MLLGQGLQRSLPSLLTHTHTRDFLIQLSTATRYVHITRKNGTYHYTETASAVSGFTGPAVPSQIATASRTANSVTIRWTQISDATGYTVYKYNTSSKSFEQVAHISGSERTEHTHLQDLKPEQNTNLE